MGAVARPRNAAARRTAPRAAGSGARGRAAARRDARAVSRGWVPRATHVPAPAEGDADVRARRARRLRRRGARCGAVRADDAAVRVLTPPRRRSRSLAHTHPSASPPRCVLTRPPRPPHPPRAPQLAGVLRRGAAHGRRVPRAAARAHGRAHAGRRAGRAHARAAGAAQGARAAAPAVSSAARPPRVLTQMSRARARRSTMLARRSLSSPPPRRPTRAAWLPSWPRGTRWGTTCAATSRPGGCRRARLRRRRRMLKHCLRRTARSRRPAAGSGAFVWLYARAPRCTVR